MPNAREWRGKLENEVQSWSMWSKEKPEKEVIMELGGNKKIYEDKPGNWQRVWE